MKQIAIVLVLVGGLGCKSREMRAFSHSDVDIAGLAARKFATEAYPLWQQNHPGKTCPATLDELNEWADSKDGKDPWGSPFKMLCGPDAPTGSKGFGVLSFGEDMKEGTPDDIKSWEQ